MEDLETEMVEFFDKLKQLKQLPKKWLLDAWNYNYRGIGIFDDLQKNMTPWQEFKSSSIDATFNLSNGDLAGMRPWIGVSSGITATQSVVFSDLTPGTVYSLKVYPASASSTTAVYTATSNDTGALMIGGKKWNSPTLGTYSSRYSWKVSFKALSTQASIKLSPATTNTTNFIYFDFVEPSIDLEFADDYYQVGDLELADSAVTWDEFKSPKLAETYTFGVSSLISVRPWIGNSSGNIATQTFQFNNLIPNKSYMMRVYPSSISAMTAEFSASITSGTGQIAGGSSYRAPAAGYITEPMPWLIMFKSDTPTLQIKLGSNNPGDFLYFDYIDADKP